MSELLLAVIVDLIIGDPKWYPHPVVIIGKGINYLERKLRNYLKKELEERIAGLILALIIIVGTYLITKQVVNLAYQINYYLGVIINIWLLSTTIAIKGLAQAGSSIYKPLLADNLSLARKRLDWIVGRDTDKLGVDEVVRGTIETIAENTSDGIIAPIFYGMIGGVPLAMAYKAVNTLDSMVGYKNDEYKYFGWASARVDDLANWIPARITGVLFIIAAFISRQDWRGAGQVILRDAQKHPSPNAGFPEAAIAGALKVRLGGINYYGGEESFRAYLGTPKVKFSPSQIIKTVELMYWNVGLLLVGYYLIIFI